MNPEPRTRRSLAIARPLRLLPTLLALLLPACDGGDGDSDATVAAPRQDAAPNLDAGAPDLGLDQGPPPRGPAPRWSIHRASTVSLRGIWGPPDGPWWAFGDGGIARLENGRFTFSPLATLGETRAVAGTQTEDGETLAWVLGSGSLLQLVDDAWEPVADNGHGPFHSLHVTSGGRAWLGGRGRVLQLEPGGVFPSVEIPEDLLAELGDRNFHGVYGRPAEAPLHHDEVWAVGPRAAFYHPPGHETENWRALPGGLIEASGVWSPAEGVAHVVGRNGRARLYWRDAYHVDLETGTTENLNAIDGADASNVWAVGDAGTLLYFNGAEWTQVALPIDPVNLHSVWVERADRVWITGDRGVVLRYSHDPMRGASPLVVEPVPDPEPFEEAPDAGPDPDLGPDAETPWPDTDSGVDPPRDVLYPRQGGTVRFIRLDPKPSGVICDGERAVGGPFTRENRHAGYMDFPPGDRTFTRAAGQCPGPAASGRDRTISVGEAVTLIDHGPLLPMSVLPDDLTPPLDPDNGRVRFVVGNRAGWLSGEFALCVGNTLVARSQNAMGESLVQPLGLFTVSVHQSRCDDPPLNTFPVSVGRGATGTVFIHRGGEDLIEATDGKVLALICRDATAGQPSRGPGTCVRVTALP